MPIRQKTLKEYYELNFKMRHEYGYNCRVEIDKLTKEPAIILSELTHYHYDSKELSQVFEGFSFGVGEFQK